jgi:hypothetical protein
MEARFILTSETAKKQSYRRLSVVPEQFRSRTAAGYKSS